MDIKMKQKIKLIAVISAEFLAVVIILLLIFLAGKKSYTVTFDLNGGTLLGGDLEQRVTQGHNATPPAAAKEGYYLLRWSGSYNNVSRDITVRAIWEYETSYGIEYNAEETWTYAEISGCFKDLTGDVYLGAYYDNKIILTVSEGAFADCKRIKSIRMLDGIVTIQDRAFENCTSMEIIDIPGTTLSIGDYAFNGCTSLKEITIPKNVTKLGSQMLGSCKSYITIYCEGTEPPLLEGGLGTLSLDILKVYVPTLSVDKYKSVWGGTIANYIYPYEF